MTANTQTQQQINTLRTLQESYDALVDAQSAQATAAALEAAKQAILTAIGNIDIDTSDLAKQGTNPNATLSEVQRLVSDIGADQALIAQCYDVLEDKGITMPQHKTLANLPQTIGLVRDIQGDISFSNGPGSFYNDPDRTIFDFSNCYVQSTAIWNAIYAVTNLTEVYFPHFVNGILGIAYAFADTQTALKIADLTNIGDCSMMGNNTNAFRAPNVESLIGKHTLEEVESGEITILNGMRISTAFSYMPKLNRASLLAIIKGVADMTGQTAPTLTFGADNIAKLTQEDLQIAYDKNWNIA